MSSVESLTKIGVEDLKLISGSPKLDAELLLCSVLGCSVTDLITHPEKIVSESDVAKYQALLSRRKLGEPIAYIVSGKEFWGLDFFVDSRVLIPRPETELLVELSLRSLRKSSLQILELGTGSGAISVALASELSKQAIDFSVVAVDRSPDALEVASLNAQRHGLSSSISFMLGSWFEPLNNSGKRFDLILSNPPYIAQSDKALSREVFFEPPIALFSGKTGVEEIEKIVLNLPYYLKQDGVFFCETGSGQRERVRDLVSQIGIYNIEFYQDLAGLDRVFSLRFSS